MKIDTKLFLSGTFVLPQRGKTSLDCPSSLSLVQFFDWTREPCPLVGQTSLQKQFSIFKLKQAGDAEEGSRRAQEMSTAGYRSGRTRLLVESN